MLKTVLKLLEELKMRRLTGGIVKFGPAELSATSQKTHDFSDFLTFLKFDL